MQVRAIGIVGTGQMGRGIAQVAAMSDYQVWMYDAAPEGVPKALQFIQGQWQKGLEKKKWEPAAVQAAQGHLHAASALGDLASCDLIIEAASESPAIKFSIFKELHKLVKKEAILASNTSSISITEIASHTGRPEQVAGMHFMNPVPVMKLVEGIRGLLTSDATFDSVAQVAQKMGKTFIRANDLPGFAVNRVLMPMINEAVFALHEGVASAADLDQAMKLGTNTPMGPLELADFIGLDTCLAIMNVLHQGLGDSKYRPCPLLKQYVAAGLLGRKSGRGFFTY